MAGESTSHDKTPHSYSSSFREKVIEHIFVGECLRNLWVKGCHSAEVLRADVDAAGYDIVMEANGIIRHIQLKSSFNDAKTSKQNVNNRLSGKPSGCVIWVGFDVNSLKLGPYFWFGGVPGSPLPDLTTFKKAKHTKGNAQGEKSERQETYCILKGQFERIATLDTLIERLFGLK